MLYPCQVIPHDIDASTRNRKFPQQKLDQRGFTGTTVAYDKNEFPFIDMKVNVLQRRRSRRISLTDFVQRNNLGIFRHCSSSFSPGRHSRSFAPLITLFFSHCNNPFSQSATFECEHGSLCA
jgi:hypothetical protein